MADGALAVFTTPSLARAGVFDDFFATFLGDFFLEGTASLLCSGGECWENNKDVGVVLQPSAKNRTALSLTIPPSRSAPRPRAEASLASVRLTHAGSLRWPRCGTGARYGASDSTSKR